MSVIAMFRQLGGERPRPVLLGELHLVRSYVAARGQRWVAGTVVATLIAAQNMTMTVGTAARVARVNCRAAGQKSHRFPRSTIVQQQAELRIGVDQITGGIEIAG